MPNHWIGWLMCAFFAGGALGGWVLLGLWVKVLWDDRKPKWQSVRK